MTNTAMLRDLVKISLYCFLFQMNELERGGKRDEGTRERSK
jgi:hypothetical protein